MNNLIVTILMIALSNGFVFAQTEPLDTDGDGYRNISTLDELRWVSENDSSWSWDFELDNNINAADTKNWNNSAGWSPIGNKKKSFQGIFNGNGFGIDSIYINRPSQRYVGFFGNIDGAEIRNVGVVNCDITGDVFVGGLVGLNSLSSVINSSSSGSVLGNEEVGGLVGRNSSSTVSNSYSTGSVSGSKQVGGLLGSNYTSTVINSYSTGNVEGVGCVGGLVGLNDVSTVSNSYSSGSVSGTEQVGGLVGDNNHSTVINSYSTGSVSGSKQVGGLLGSNSSISMVINSYSTGSVEGDDDVGGLVGSNSDLSTVQGSFWDTQTSGIDSSAGGTGKTTEEMKTKSTYTNAYWNFDFIWDISTSYPVIDIDTAYRPSDTDADGYLNASTLTDLLWLSESGFDLDSDWELDNDINAADTKNWNGALGFSPIGFNYPTRFSGEFEGHGYKIDSLYINRPSQSFVGFFGNISDAEIRNVGVVNCDITGYGSVGGLAGGNFASTVINSYSTGSVEGTGNGIGGLVGYNYVAYVSNSYSRVSVSGNEKVGGLVGYNNQASSVTNSYSTGSVEGIDNVGGLVGDNHMSEVVYSFWDTQTSGQSTSSGGTGKSTAEMKTKSTFTDAGWDFENIWKIDGVTNDGYPYFRDEPTSILESETIVDKNIFVYPNPAGDYIEITIGSDSNGASPIVNEMAIYDVLGTKVKSVARGHAPLSNQRIDISHLPHGVYFVRIGYEIERFVKM